MKSKYQLEEKYTQAVMSKFENAPRAQRRPAERELKDDFKIFHKFSDNQVQVVNRMVAYVANELATERIDEIMDSINRCIITYFNIRFEDMSEKEIEKEFRVLDSLMEEDSRKIELLIKECGGNKEMAKAKMTKSLEEIEVMCNELLDKGTKQKQAIEILEGKFKDTPKSILTNKFKEIKAEREVKEVDPEIVQAAEYIFGEDEKKEVTKVNTPKEVEKPGQDKKVYYIPIVVWGKTAEAVANYTHKGSLVAVTGKLTTRSYNAKDGGKRYITEVVADMQNGIEFLDGKNSNNNQGGYQQQGNIPEDYFGGGDMAPIDDGEDMPF